MKNSKKKIKAKANKIALDSKFVWDLIHLNDELRRRIGWMNLDIMLNGDVKELKMKTWDDIYERYHELVYTKAEELDAKFFELKKLTNFQKNCPEDKMHECN